ncbi:MAG: peptide chain release factor N(5)-glutamine methyltransferase [Coriobacteriales bacterium]|nr:peptide chain release factor N(5)-glutamine methyltransferase [Coriobacteriales bacterium]
MDKITVKDALNEACNILEGSSFNCSSKDAVYIICNVCDFSKTELQLNLNNDISSQCHSLILDYANTRAKGEPLQYIFGNTNFYGFDILCKKNVLIPRPETEYLVSKILDNYADTINHDPIKVLEIGTGTGAIAITLAKKINVQVTATDISIPALNLAKQNAQKLSCADKIEFLLSDALDKVDGTYDLLVSNPPYIPSDAISSLDEEVKDFEPIIALDGGNDGLEVFRKILKDSTRVLNKGALIAFELYEKNVNLAAQLCCNAGFEDVSIQLDLAQKPRFLFAKFT